MVLPSGKPEPCPAVRKGGQTTGSPRPIVTSSNTWWTPPHHRLGSRLNANRIYPHFAHSRIHPHFASISYIHRITILHIYISSHFGSWALSPLAYSVSSDIITAPPSFTPFYHSHSMICRTTTWTLHRIFTHFIGFFTICIFVLYS